jgi:hypothetical protein
MADFALIIRIRSGKDKGDVTVNLNHPLQSDTFAFLDENNMPGIGIWLRKKKLGINMEGNARSGFCINPLYMLLMPVDITKALWIRGLHFFLGLDDVSR